MANDLQIPENGPCHARVDALESRQPIEVWLDSLDSAVELMHRHIQYNALLST